jgi:hypothetical protein
MSTLTPPVISSFLSILLLSLHLLSPHGASGEGQAAALVGTADTELRAEAWGRVRGGAPPPEVHLVTGLNERHGRSPYPHGPPPAAMSDAARAPHPCGPQLAAMSCAAQALHRREPQLELHIVGGCREVRAAAPELHSLVAAPAAASNSARPPHPHWSPPTAPLELSTAASRNSSSTSSAVAARCKPCRPSYIASWQRRPQPATPPDLHTPTGRRQQRRSISLCHKTTITVGWSDAESHI